MLRVEKACINCMMDLKKSKDIGKDLERHKNLVFKTAMEVVYGEKVWEKIENFEKTS